MQQVQLGRTGIQVSHLAIGTGTAGVNGRSDQSKLGVDGLARLLLHAKDKGITFWDTANDYGTHPHVARALQQVKREEIVITTKTFSRTAAALKEDIHRFLQELGTTYIDIVLLHCLMDANWPQTMAAGMEVLTRFKEAGIIRALGVSCHNLGAFQVAAGHPWVDVVLARINYQGAHMDASPDQIEPILATMHAAGQGVYGMKVYGQGRLVSDRKKALSYVLGLGSVDAIVIGMRNPEEVDDNVALLAELE